MRLDSPGFESLIFELLERLNAVYAQREMEQLAICWAPEDAPDPFCLNPHLVTEPGGLSELSVDLDDKESRKHYLAHGYMNAVLDGYLTPEQASAAGDAGKALLKELGLTEDDVKALGEFNANLNRLNRMAAGMDSAQIDALVYTMSRALGGVSGENDPTEDAAPKHSALPEKTEECYAPWMLAMPEKLRDPETLRQAQE